MGYSTDKLSTKWNFNGKIQNCSYVHHSDSTGQNSGSSGDSDSSHGSDGSDEYYAKGSSTDNVFLTNEDFDDVYDNCTSSSNGCNYNENASGSGYYIPKSNSKYNYSNYHNGNQNSGSQNSGNQTTDDQNDDVNNYAGNGNVNGDDVSETADASGAGNDGASGYDQSGEQNANSDYSEDVSTETYDPYGSFEISQCDTYEKLWIWDLALSCKNDQLLDSCQCTFASQLMSQNMLSCSDMSNCPTDCQVCNTCMQLLGCDDATGFAALMKSPLFWILLVAGILICGLGCYLVILRRRRDQQNEEKGYLNVGLMADDASSTSGSSNGRSRSPLLGSPLSSPDTTPPSSPIWLAPSIPPRNSTTNDVESNSDAIDSLSTPTLQETWNGVWLAPIPELSSARNTEGVKSTESTVEDTDSAVAPTEYVVDNDDISMSDEGTTDVGLAPAMRYMDANDSDAEKENEANATLPMKPEVESQTDAETDDSTLANNITETENSQLSVPENETDIGISALPADQNVTMTDNDIAAICDTLEENESSANQIESVAISSTEFNHSESDGTFDYSTDVATQSDATTASQSNVATDEDLQNDESEPNTNVIKRFAW